MRNAGAIGPGFPLEAAWFLLRLIRRALRVPVGRPVSVHLSI